MIRLLILIDHVYFWVICDLCNSNNGHQKDMCLDNIGLRFRIMIIILDSTINMIEGRGEGRAVWPFDEDMKFQIDTKYNKHIIYSSKSYEESGYHLVLDY